MNIEEFEKTKKELEKLKAQNNEQMSISDERTRMSKVNSFENKVIITLAFSMIGYLFVFILSYILIKSIGVNTFTNIIPALIYPAVVVGSSFGIGTLINFLINKKYKTKDRYKSFSIAKTKVEKLEEEIYYKIEFEKANNRNKAVDETIKVLESNQEMLNKMSSRYNLSDKEVPQSKEESEIKEKELSDIIKEQYDRLDILTTQKVLHDNFWRIRSRFQKGTDIMMASLITGMFTTFFTVYPFMMVRDVITYSLSFTIAPFVIGIIGTGGYMLKRNKDHKKVFNNFNLQLGENALVERYEKYEGAYEEQQEIERLIETQIRDISITQIQLQENKRYLDTFLTEEDKIRAIIEQPYSQLKITDKTREDVLNHPERYINCDVRICMGKFYTDEEYEQRRNEVLSKSLPTLEQNHKLGKKKVLAMNNKLNK